MKKSILFVLAAGFLCLASCTPRKSLRPVFSNGRKQRSPTASPVSWKQPSQRTGTRKMREYDFGDGGFSEK